MHAAIDLLLRLNEVVWLPLLHSQLHFLLTQRFVVAHEAISVSAELGRLGGKRRSSHVLELGSVIWRQLFSACNYIK